METFLRWGYDLAKIIQRIIPYPNHARKSCPKLCYWTNQSTGRMLLLSTAIYLELGILVINSQILSPTRVTSTWSAVSNPWSRFKAGLLGTSTSPSSRISKFLFSVLALLLCIQEVVFPTMKALNENSDVRDDLRDGNEGFKDSGRPGRRRPTEAWFKARTKRKKGLYQNLK